MSTDKSKVSVITDTMVLSYPHLDTPQVEKDDNDVPTGKSKYSCALIGLQGFNWQPLRDAVNAAADAAYPGQGAEMIRTKKLKSPIRDDAEAKNYPVGSLFLNVRTEKKPGIVYSYKDTETQKAAIMPAEKIKNEMYAGAQVRASLTAFAYNRKGNKGVSFALNNLQKVGEGERIDGRVAAENEFTANLNEAPADFGTSATA